MNEQETYELIESFLDGMLDDQQTAEVEARIASDAEFRQEVDLHRELRNAIGDGEAMHLSNALAAVDAELFEQGGGLEESEVENESEVEESASPEPEAPVRPLWAQRYAIAASLLLLVLVGGFFLLNLGGPDGEALYDTHFSPYTTKGLIRGEDSLLKANYLDAFAAYDAKNFDAAYENFQGILRQDSSQKMAAFYLSMSAMAKGEYGAAISYLDGLAKTSGHDYVSQSRWYLALAHLHEQHIDDARELLETLSKGKGAYAKKAQALLEDL
ncbi:MAG: hypothetical protein AAF570_09700 [Bacteroidota bacterium]